MGNDQVFDRFDEDPTGHFFYYNLVIVLVQMLFLVLA
jgi:hypothetical protein